MKGFGSLFLRELRRRLPIHVISLALGLIVVSIPWLRGGMSVQDAAEIRGAAAVGVAILWSLALATVDGLGFLAGDLGERRLAFDFRLPMTDTSIWAARTLAALVSIITAALLVLGLPALLGSDLAWGIAGASQMLAQSSGDLSGQLFVRVTGLNLPHPVPLFVLALLGILLLLNLVGLARASRSGWFLVDFLTVIATLGFGVATAAPFWWASATRLAVIVASLSLGSVFAALIVATWYQTTLGRTEPDRAHRAFSRSFASIAIAAPLALMLWTQWYIHPSAESLIPLSGERHVARRIRAVPLSADLVYLAGPTEHRRQLSFGFVLEPRSGRRMRVGRPRPQPSRTATKMSLDGSILVWEDVRQTNLQRWTTTLRWMSADEFPSEGQESAIVWKDGPFSWTLSADGKKVASVWRSTSGTSKMRLLVEELVTGSLLATVPIDNCRNEGLVLFIDETRFLYACGTAYPGDDTPQARLFEILMETGEVIRRWGTPIAGWPLDNRLALAPGRFFEPPQPDRGRLFPPHGARLHVRGRPRLDILPPSPLPANARSSQARFLSDGSLVVFWYSYDRSQRMSTLGKYDPMGRLLSARESPIAYFPFILADLDGGQSLVVGNWDRQSLLGSPHITVSRLPLNGGEIVEIARELHPHHPESAATPTTVFSDADGNLLWLDLESGKLVPLLPGHRPRDKAPKPASTGQLATETYRN